MMTPLSSPSQALILAAERVFYRYQREPDKSHNGYIAILDLHNERKITDRAAILVKEAWKDFCDGKYSDSDHDRMISMCFCAAILADMEPFLTRRSRVNLIAAGVFHR